MTGDYIEQKKLFIDPEGEFERKTISVPELKGLMEDALEAIVSQHLSQRAWI
jgi:hypothetical protein